MVKIKFIGSEELFIKYLEQNGIKSKDIYYLENEKLKKFFLFDSEEEKIAIKISLFNGNYRCKIFEKYFYFFQKGKTIIEYDELGKENKKIFQTFEEEDKYIETLKENSNDFELEIYNSKNWEKYDDISKIEIIDYRDKIYKTKKIKNCKVIKNYFPFSPYYKEYIYIINDEAYKDFLFDNSKIRTKLFFDLDLVLSSTLKTYFAICGHFGSGKTTSILHYINSNLGIYQIVYINCFTMVREDLNNSDIKSLLNYEIERGIKQEKIKKAIKSYIDEKINDNLKRNNDFIFDIIKNIILIYKTTDDNEILNFIIDQYSSKYDHNNKHFYSLNEICIAKDSKSRLILVSSMNNTCVNSNLKKTLEKEKKIFVSHPFIKYNLYGQLYDDSNIITENNIKNIMNQFGNSKLIYYKLKSIIIECEKKGVEINKAINNFIQEECSNIKNEIINYYDIVKKDYETGAHNNFMILKLFEFLNEMKTKRFLNYNQFSFYLEIFPFKFIKIKYYELNIAHLEFIQLFPKEIRRTIILFSYFKHLQEENNSSPLSGNFENSFENINDYLNRFTGKEKKIVSFFSIEPIYRIIENCCKELLLFYAYKNTILEELFEEGKGGFKGEIFELIIINQIIETKKLWNYNFDEVNEKEDFQNIITTSNINSNKSINYSKKKYSKSKDGKVFEELKKIIDQTIYPGNQIEKKKLEKKSIFLNQIYSNGKYVDCGLLIYHGEQDDNSLNFILKVFQISIKKEKQKIYDRNEVSLILVYMKEYLESIFTNLKIINASYYYIIDAKKPDKDIVNLCKQYSLGCLGFNIEVKAFNSINNSDFNISRFSKFNSSFILKENVDMISNSIDNEEPVLYEKIDKKKMKKFFEPLFKRDISIPDYYYIYNNLELNLDIINKLTNYSLLISLDELGQNVKYIFLNEKLAIEYDSENVVNINSTITNNNNLKLISFLVAIKCIK